MSALIKNLKMRINDMDKPLLFFTIVMLGFGLLNIVTASSREAVSKDVELYYYFYRHLIMIIAGCVLSFFIINIPTSFYKKFGIVPIIILAAYMALSLLSASEIRGAKNWSTIGNQTFQPSEFAKPLVIVVLASLYDLYYRKLVNPNIKHTEIIVKIILASLIIPIIVFFQKDLGTMFIQLVIFMTMFLVSPVSIREKFETFGVLTIFGVLSIGVMIMVRGNIFTEEQIGRFTNFRQPCHNYEDDGYQVCNGIIAINDGGLFGVGIGKSKQKYSYIPEPHTDSVFAIIAEEYGLIRVTPIFAIYLFILYRILLLAKRANTIRGRYICLGVGIYIFTHIFINLGGLFALIPLTGVPLPFLSYGGSFTISLIAALALVQRVHIETKNQKIKIQ
ncbi:MAG: FtsW/RodA/SpoVE family cell cycle protein [Mollicutes bacterium]|jgi:cell division protein FtsW|nr:FtsW/RodA/SpoVE family cell cycle protein [Mollicutes bacterium]